MALNLSLRAEHRAILSLLQAGRRERQATDVYKRLLAVNELAAEMTAAHDLDELRGCLARAYEEWMPEGSVCLCLVGNDHYDCRQLSGHATFLSEGSYPLSYGLVGRSLQRRVPVLITDIQELASVRDDAGLEGRARSLMVLPLLAVERVIGCLGIASGEPKRFTPLDYHFALLVAAHLSSALQGILARQQLAASNQQLRDQERRLTELNQLLRDLAVTDDLVQLNCEIARVQRYGGELSCLMIDIDGFKQVNDSYGHLVGDQVLRGLGDLFRRCSRATDFIARYGGDEFTAMLPQTDAHGAASAAEKLRRTVKEHPFALGADRLSLTISVGAVTCANPVRLDAAELISRADRALYRAKRAGGDVVFAANPFLDDESRICQAVERALTQYAFSD